MAARNQASTGAAGVSWSVSRPLPRGPRVVFEGKMLNYRGNWKGSVVSSILEPVLFLAAMGISLGTLVDAGGRLDQGVDYLVFLAPGLLAATATQTATFESTNPIMGAFKWNKLFEGVLATPVKAGDLVSGHLLFIVFRLSTSLAVFLAVMAAFGALELPLGLLALPAAVLTGLAFAATTPPSPPGPRTTPPSPPCCASGSLRCSCSRAPSFRYPNFRGCRSRWPTRRPCGMACR